MLKLKNLLSYFFVVVLYSCAQIISPSGGEKDVNPPQVIKTNPPNYSTNFNIKTTPKIEIIFDEYIQLKNVQSELMISPVMKEIPDITVKGKTLFVKFPSKSELQNNTTYILDFGNSITDITENNAFVNYKYIFSTGDKLDSLRVSGEVLNAFNNKPEENVFVFLYDSNFDSLPYKTLPTYYTKTDKTGKFEFNHIKNNVFKNFALKDKNSNFLYDLPSESIAFLKDMVHSYYPKPSDTTDKDTIKGQWSPDYVGTGNETIEHIKLYLFDEKKNIRQKINNISLDYMRLTIILNLPSVNINIKPINQKTFTPWEAKEVNYSKDTIIFWLDSAINKSDSIMFEIKDESLVLDTINIKNLRNKRRGGGTDKPELRIENNIKNNTLDIFNNVCLTLSNPVESYDSSKILLLRDKDTIKPIISKDMTSTRKFLITTTAGLEEKTNYTLNILPGAFTDIYNLKNDTLLLNFKTTELSDYGSIILSLSFPDTSNYILQLLDNNEQIVNEQFINLAGKIIYQNLKPGKYKLKIIYDENNNKKWDTGDYLNKIQPEKVIYYPAEIQVRANWDLDVSWEMK